MRIFVTGATGFVGTAVVQELLAAGYQVLGLARSSSAAGALRAAGAEVQRGDLEDEASLHAGAAACDGIIHTGFVHDFSRYKEACELDRRVIAALGSSLRGTDKPLIVTSGTLALAADGHLTEAHRFGPEGSRVHARAASEEAADALVEQGVRAGVVRLPPTTHGAGDHGFVPMLLSIAKEKQAAAYIGEGDNRWPAVHRLDAARAFVKAMERTTPGERFHAVGESAIPYRDIATAIGRLQAVPVVSVSAEQAAAHFGWLCWAVASDGAAASALTREKLDWTPTQPTLLDDLANGVYAS